MDVYCRVDKTESLINSHIYVPKCMTGSLVLPGLCDCGEDNSCGRLTIGQPTLAVLFDTEYTFVCTNDTARYAQMLSSSLSTI